MNPGETLPQNRHDDAELGEALHQRLSQLAARLQRLTGGLETGQSAGGESLAAAQKASDSFFDFGESSGREARSEPDRPLPIARPQPSQGYQPAAEAPAATPARQTAAENDHRAAEERLRTIRNRIEALKARHNGTDDRRPSVTAEASGRTPEPASSRKGIDFNAAIEEIAARQRAIDESASTRTPASTEAKARPPRSTASAPAAPRDDSEIASLRDRIDQLSRSIDETKRPEPASGLGGPAEVRGFERGSEDPPSRGSGPESDALAELAAQLRDLKDGIATIPNGPCLEAIHASHHAIERRLEELASRPAGGDFGDLAQQILSRLPTGERIDALSAEIDRLTERMSSADQSGAMTQIAERLAAFEQQISGLQATTGASGIDRRIEAEMSGLRDAVEGLYRMLHNNGSPALARLEDRLNQVSSRLESALESAPRADSVSDLLSRLELIAARGESAPAALESLASEIAELRARERSELASLDMHIQTLAQRLDDVIADRSSGPAGAEVEARIEELTRRLDELSQSPPNETSGAEIEQLETQLAHLSSRLSNLGANDGSEGGLTRLEQQVASLLQRLEVLSADHDTLRTVQDNLSRLESIVVDSEVNAVDNLQAAARDAVRELSGLGGDNSEALEALKADLRELQAAADSSDRQTSATLDTVHDTLDRVVHRLSSLEADLRGGEAKPAAAPAAPVSRAAAPEAATATAATGATGLDRPAAPATTKPREAKAAPQLGDPQPPSGAASDRDRRADFIAAARRAAQAAAAEHGAMRRTSVLEDREEEDDSPGALARLNGAMSRHRRPLLLAAGAIVLAIAAFQIARPLLGSEPDNPEPVVEEAVPEAGAGDLDAPVLDIPAIPAPAAGADDNAAEVAPPASPAFVPPAGVVSPRSVDAAAPNAGAAVEEGGGAAAENGAGVAAVNGADAVYDMPEEAIGSVRLRVAAAAGDPAALYEVGARYADGSGVARDLDAAALWLERAAEAGLAVAQHRIATHYEAGLGVPEDRAIAFEWYSAAAEQGNVMAMHNLGVMYSQGIEGEADFAGAVEWFTRAAERGIRDSQYNLGVIFARGIGVDQDLPASYRWFAIAAQQGDTDAAARRDEVAAALGEEELAAARAAVSAFTPIGAPADANMVESPEGGWDAEDERVSTDDGAELVMTIQGLLAERGYEPGPADGVAGPMTVDAVRAFQSESGLEPTGTIDTTLLAALSQ